MGEKQLHVVTGAFGFSGKYITHRLLDEGHRVKTLTNSPDRVNPFAGQVEVRPFNFDKPESLVESLRGAAVLYNTYWVRFNHQDFAHVDAVTNTLTLFSAAKTAGVRRIVHVSITNPSESSSLEYFSGKARLERALIESGLSYAILRPTVLFGEEDILVNNIAWFLRKFPVFGVFGDGNYRLQPIYVDDLAKVAIEQGGGKDNLLVDAIGPETYTYRELVRTIGAIIGKPRPIISIPPRLGYLVGSTVGRFKGDVLITREEIEGLMAELLYVDSEPAGETKLSEWAKDNAETLGEQYANELSRRQNRQADYSEL